MRWFGETWFAPINEDVPHVARPVGEPCAKCEKPINKQDDGFLIPHIDGNEARERPWHRDCFMEETLGDWASRAR